MYNTPPTYGIYIAGLVFQWLKRQGGVGRDRGAATSPRRSCCTTTSTARRFYENRVDAGLPLAHERALLPARRDACNDAFLAGAKAAGLLQLKGHKSVGGMRAVDLQRDAARRRAGAGRLHAGLRAHAMASIAPAS